MKGASIIYALIWLGLIGCGQSAEVDLSLEVGDDPAQNTVETPADTTGFQEQLQQAGRNLTIRARNPFVPGGRREQPATDRVERKKTLTTRNPSRLVLQGIVWRRGRYRAVINGTAYGPGEEDRTLRILRITPESVTLYHKPMQKVVILTWQSIKKANKLSNPKP